MARGNSVLTQKLSLMKGLAATLKSNLERELWDQKTQRQNAVVAQEILELAWDIEGAHSIELSDREKQVRDLVIDGLSNIQIASALFIDEKTVKFHLSAIFKKLGCRNRAGLIVEHYRNELARVNADKAVLQQKVDGLSAGSDSGRGIPPRIAVVRDGDAGAGKILPGISKTPPQPGL